MAAISTPALIIFAAAHDEKAGRERLLADRAAVVTAFRYRPSKKCKDLAQNLLPKNHMSALSSWRTINQLACEAYRCKLGAGTRPGRAPARLVGRFLPRLGAACRCWRLFFSNYSRPFEDASAREGKNRVFFRLFLHSLDASRQGTRLGRSVNVIMAAFAGGWLAGAQPYAPFARCASEKKTFIKQLECESAHIESFRSAQ